ncbi:MAG: FAD-dependent monooxygenase, partial [Bacteroidetes bacterium]|nr:FAD-dependent monooxygenase [Bacteroidota bacterium]
SEAASEQVVKEYISKATGKNIAGITGFHILKKSLDARSRQAWINLTIQAYIDEPFTERILTTVHFRDVRHAQRSVIIIGAGPCGLFAALRLIELGIRPIVLERGKDVRARRRDLALLNKEGEVNPESNYCFGEGGAGTYSDGKLYTRSSKRGDISRVLNLLVRFGATEKILYEAHPHIGTNKLPGIISAMRGQITDSGGQVLFEKKLSDLIIKDDEVTGVRTADGDVLAADAVVLATGHSARDVFRLLHAKQLSLEAKPFALGVRIEHPQALIDEIQYHCRPAIPAGTGTRSAISCRDPFLPPASYSLVEQVTGRGVFSFCMCPGGIIAAAATAPGELVVNGWSPSKRNNPYANSGMVVQTELKDALAFFKGKRDAKDPLVLMDFQSAVEQKAFAAGGGRQVAPAQTMTDFVNRKTSSRLPDCSYVPGIHSAPLAEVLPGFVYQSLQEGFKAFGRKMRGYLTNEAVVLATESRTSSPVRIPRDADRLCHPQLRNLYPAGEGAGYAGGIVSAAMDGERVASVLAQVLG